MEDITAIEQTIPRKGEITFKGLVSATIDTVRLYRSGDVHPIGALVLIGMKAAYPEKFGNAQLRSDPNLDFFNTVVWLGVEVNDAVDIIPQARIGQNQEVVEDIFGTWKKILKAVRGVTGYSEEKNQLLTNYQREILFCERMAREWRGEHSLEDIRSYREVMNAISIVHNAGALLGSDALPTHLDTIDKADLNWNTLRNKYDWIVNGKPQDDTERRLCALYNLVMGVQVIDDYCDLVDDRRLGLNTIASELLKDKPDKKVAEGRIRNDAENYFRKAEEFGVSQHAWMGLQFIFKTMKKLQSRFPDKVGGRRERLLNGGKQIMQEA